jgi:ribosome maturation factor RimP
LDLIQLRRNVRAAIEDSIVRLGYDLVAVEWVGTRTLRLSVDKPGGIEADDCAKVSQHVSPLLDEADPIEQAYTLEVSSPGIDRPVERLDDFRRFTGFRAKIKLNPGPARRRYTGRLAGVEQDELLVDVDGTIHRLFLDAIAECHLVLDLDEFERIGEGLPPLPTDPAAAPAEGAAVSASPAGDAEESRHDQ